MRFFKNGVLKWKKKVGVLLMQLYLVYVVWDFSVSCSLCSSLIASVSLSYRTTPTNILEWATITFLFFLLFFFWRILDFRICNFIEWFNHCRVDSFVPFIGTPSFGIGAFSEIGPFRPSGGGLLVRNDCSWNTVACYC